MSERELVCINCPMGCRLNVTLDGDKITAVTGNSCPRGDAYARSEVSAPTRTVTTLVRVAGRSEPLSVKTSAPVAKALVFDCVAAAQSVVVSAPVHIGDVVVADVCGSGADLVATAAVE